MTLLFFFLKQAFVSTAVNSCFLHAVLGSCFVAKQQLIAKFTWLFCCLAINTQTTFVLKLRMCMDHVSIS